MALIRIDKYLSVSLGISRTDAKSLLKTGSITVDGKPCKKADTKIDETALVKNGVKYVAEGANMPSTLEAIEVFQAAKNTVYLPAKAANAGGVATSALEMAQSSGRLYWSSEEVDAKLKTIMINIYHNIDSAAKRYGYEGNYVMGANIAGFEKVAEAMMAHGIV